MLHRNSTNFSIFSMVLDGLLVALSLWLAALLRPWASQLPGILPIDDPIQPPVGINILFPALWVLINLWNAVYDGQRNYRIMDEVSRLMISCLLATGAMAGLLYTTYREMSRAQFVLFVLLAFLFLLAWRLIVRVYWRLRFRNRNNHRHVLIAGANEVGTQIAAALRRRTTVIHFLDDDPEKQSRPEVLGPLSALKTVLIQYEIDDVIFALPEQAHKKVTNAVLALRSYPVNVWLVPAMHRLALYRAAIEEFGGVPLLNLRAPAISASQRMVKRIFDIVFSAVFLLLAAIPILVIMLIIRLDSPGPVIFRQKRVGENGQPFGMFKFRTMVQNAEALRHTVEKTDTKGNVIHKHRNDPRLTRVGGFLRRYSLDELPQFINVLRGEMSAVGPRPEMPFLVEKYEPWQYIRFSIPQGVTGWWQVNGRSDKPMHLNTEDDLYYVRNYSFWLDIQILLRTVLVVLHGKGAY